jgi:hypothetical protein
MSLSQLLIPVLLLSLSPQGPAPTAPTPPADAAPPSALAVPFTQFRLPTDCR